MENHPPPYFPPELEIIIRALQDLAGDRINTVGGISNIPFKAKLEFARWAGIQDIDTFIDIMNVADQAFVDTVNNKNSKAKKAN